MLQIDETEYELVEKILLGRGKFNTLQREFIELLESKLIIAGPGTGKTTSLSAKITFLMRYLNKIGSKEGICIITHTNVAVNEINTTLQKSGISNITHPHFIGTIHEFFNKYCVLPLFKKNYKHNSFIFDGKPSDDIEYYRKFLNSKYYYMQDGAKKFIAEKVHVSPLVFDRSSSSLEIENSSNWPKFEKYKDDALRAKLSRKSKGFLRYDDTFLFAEIFLSNPIYMKMLRDRFKYIFIDEFQDTTPKGLELLKSIFVSDGNILQMIGDPYQTISYGQPMPEIDENEVFRLNVTNRFGEEIAGPLNILMPEANIQTSKSKRSFPPILLVYQDEKEIYAGYKKIIEEYEKVDTEFRDCKMSDKVLVRNRNWASRVIEGEGYNNDKPNKRESQNVQLKSKVMEFIYKKIKDKKNDSVELRKWIKNHPSITILHGILLDILKHDLDIVRKRALKDFINNLLQDKQTESIDLRASLFKEIENILGSVVELEKESCGSSNDIFTIHSVKGESLRSALVVNYDDAPLTNILFHRYKILDDANYNHNDHNLLYVAMSRVVYLFVFAIHQDEVNEEILESFKGQWIIKKA